MKVLIINGSYRPDGITDQAVMRAAEALKSAGASAELIYLRNQNINFCTNCRTCTQQPGELPGVCVQDDDMRLLVEKIESADAFVLASPTNLSSATALFKRFMERLVVYAYWPWGAHAPVYRKKYSRKRSLLITSSASPGFVSRLFFSTMSQLKLAAKVLGAPKSKGVFIGFASLESKPGLPIAYARKIDRGVDWLLS